MCIYIYTSQTNYLLRKELLPSDASPNPRFFLYPNESLSPMAGQPVFAQDLRWDASQRMNPTQPSGNKRPTFQGGLGGLSNPVWLKRNLEPKRSNE